MRSIERNAFKLSSGLIELSDFEEELYSKSNIDLMNTDELIYQLIGINFRGKHWKRELDYVLESVNTRENFLLKTIYFGCQRILEEQELGSVEDIIYEFSKLNIENDYEYDFLMEFYSLGIENDSLEDGYGSLTKNEILHKAKSLGRDFVDGYNKKKSFEDLLYNKGIIHGTGVLFSEDEIVQYRSSKKVNLESTKVLDDRLRKLNFDKEIIERIDRQSNEETLKKILVRIPIYLLLGIILLFVGISSITKDIGTILYGFILIGFGLLVTSVCYIFKWFYLRFFKK